jgi:hypothetical protein
MLRRVRRAVRELFDRVGTAVTEAGQTTAEYALVILGAAAIGTLVLTWATKSHVIGKLFDTVIGKILPG